MVPKIERYILKYGCLRPNEPYLDALQPKSESVAKSVATNRSLSETQALCPGTGVSERFRQSNRPTFRL